MRKESQGSRVSFPFQLTQRLSNTKQFSLIRGIAVRCAVSRSVVWNKNMWWDNYSCIIYQMLHNLMIYPLPSRSIFTLYQALLSLHSLEGMLNVELLVEDFTVNILVRLLRRLFHFILGVKAFVFEISCANKSRKTIAKFINARQNKSLIFVWTRWG